MVEYNILDYSDCVVEDATLVKRAHIERESEDALTASTLLDEARKVARPRAAWGVAYIGERDESSVMAGDVRLTSRVLAVNLRNAHRVFPFVATCGTDLDDWARGVTGIMESFWADTIKELFLFEVFRAMRRRIAGDFRLAGHSEMSPGSLEDWPMSEQRQLFTLLGTAAGDIGVTLTDSFLMLPTKSISGILFPTGESFESCQLCPRTDCRGRRAPYDPELYDRKYRT